MCLYFTQRSQADKQTEGKKVTFSRTTEFIHAVSQTLHTLPVTRCPSELSMLRAPSTVSNKLSPALKNLNLPLKIPAGTEVPELITLFEFMENPG